MRIASLLCASFLLSSPALYAATTPDDNALELVSTFSVSAPTMIPGKTLKPGNYSIKVIDHLSDRILLEVDGPKGKAESRFLGMQNATIRSGAVTGPIVYSITHGDAALRGFAFPGGATTEFVYPKAEAVTIAKASASHVPAIDPASEGRPEAKNLSKSDLQMVTLWTLSSTRVGPENASEPAIQAERYQQPVATPVQSAGSPGSMATAPASPQVALHDSSTNAVMPRQHVTRVKPPIMMASLPHTASNLPLIFIASVLLFFAAGITRRIRIAVRAR